MISTAVIRAGCTVKDYAEMRQAEAQARAAGRALVSQRRIHEAMKAKAVLEKARVWGWG